MPPLAHLSNSSKKFLLSSLVVAAFAAYSLHARDERHSVTITAPPALQSTKSSGASSQPSVPAGSGYKDGAYTGTPADALYGNIQVQATIRGGAITDVTFLQYPNDRNTSVSINEQAMPYLKQEAIRAQSAQVDGVSGATDTSQAFIQSLASALTQAKL